MMMKCYECQTYKHGVKRVETDSDVLYLCPECYEKYQSLIRIKNNLRMCKINLRKEIESVGVE